MRKPKFSVGDYVYQIWPSEFEIDEGVIKNISRGLVRGKPVYSYVIGRNDIYKSKDFTFKTLEEAKLALMKCMQEKAKEILNYKSIRETSHA